MHVVLHAPLAWQVFEGAQVRAPCGAPGATLLQVPGAALSQAWQEPVHGELQQ